MKQAMLYGLALLLVLSAAGCDDTEESTYKTENCAAATDFAGQEYELCCRVKCVAEVDWDDYEESCIEETTCSTATGAACPASVAQAFRAPPCLY